MACVKEFMDEVIEGRLREDILEGVGGSTSREVCETTEHRVTKCASRWRIPAGFLDTVGGSQGRIVQAPPKERICRSSLLSKFGPLRLLARKNHRDGSSRATSLSPLATHIQQRDLLKACAIR